MIKNENYNWTDVEKTVKEAFVGTPDKVLIKSTAIIARFHQYDTIAKDEKSSTNLSPWWFVYSGDKGSEFIDVVKKSEKSFKGYAREIFALPPEWNSMIKLFMYHPIYDIYGFYGEIASQYVKGIDYKGGWKQLYIPDFVNSDLNLSSRKEALI